MKLEKIIGFKKNAGKVRKSLLLIAGLEIHPKNISGFIWIVCVFQSLYDIRKYLAFMYKPWLILNSIYCQLCIWNHDKDLMSLNGHEKANEPENESFAYLWCYVQLVHIPATAKAWHSSLVNFPLGFSTPFNSLNWSFIPRNEKKNSWLVKGFWKLDLCDFIIQIPCCTFPWNDKILVSKSFYACRYVDKQSYSE